MSFTFVDVDSKKILENELRFETDVVLNLFCHVLSVTCVDGTLDVGSVTRISFTYGSTYGFWNKHFQKMSSPSITLCLFIHNSRSKHSRKTTVSNLHKHLHFSDISANNCFQF